MGQTRKIRAHSEALNESVLIPLSLQILPSNSEPCHLNGAFYRGMTAVDEKSESISNATHCLQRWMDGRRWSLLLMQQGFVQQGFVQQGTALGQLDDWTPTCRLHPKKWRKKRQEFFW